jgi:hypothetical protein
VLLLTLDEADALGDSRCTSISKKKRIRRWHKSVGEWMKTKQVYEKRSITQPRKRKSITISKVQIRNYWSGNFMEVSYGLRKRSITPKFS